MSRPRGPAPWTQDDPDGRKVRLAGRTWDGHIEIDHPEVPNPDVIRGAIEDPDLVVADLNRKPGAQGASPNCRGLVEGRFGNMSLAVAAEWAAAEWEEVDSDGVEAAYLIPRPVSRGRVGWVRPRSARISRHGEPTPRLRCCARPGCRRRPRAGRGRGRGRAGGTGSSGSPSPREPGFRPSGTVPPLRPARPLAARRDASGAPRTHPTPGSGSRPLGGVGSGPDAASGGERRAR